MNLHHLAIFLAIAETGSITASSRRLHISQPALSRELKSFEERLGVTLFERQSKGMRLTDAGEILRDYAARLFDIARSAEAAMHEIADARRGHLTIGASNTIGTYVLPRTLATFRRKYPDVHVSLFVGNTEQVSEGVADLRFMLGFIEGPLHLGGLTATTFQNDEIIPVVATDHPLRKVKRLKVADLDNQPLLMREHGSGTRELIADLFQAQGVNGGDVMEFSNTEALKQAVVHGGGVAWLPRISVESELRNKQLHELGLKPMRIVRPLKVLWREAGYLSPSVVSFLNLLCPQLKIQPGKTGELAVARKGLKQGEK